MADTLVNVSNNIHSHENDVVDDKDIKKLSGTHHDVNPAAALAKVR
ncbi:hypothetical protein A2U01_0091940, partial [Trifolium medium]|nr:hypothetical protein [Trifolium medium]